MENLVYLATSNGGSISIMHSESTTIEQLVYVLFGQSQQAMFTTNNSPFLFKEKHKPIELGENWFNQRSAWQLSGTFNIVVFNDPSSPNEKKPVLIGIIQFYAGFVFFIGANNG